MQTIEDYLKIALAMVVAFLITTVIFPVALFFVVWGVLTVVIYFLIDYLLTKVQGGKGGWKWK